MMMQQEQQWQTTRTEPIPKPPFRRLRGYAFDPSLSTQMDTALVNEVVFKVPWEQAGPDGLSPGPVGEYLEIVDNDPASGCFYEPLNLDSPLVLAQDGLVPSEGNPQFHQQMVYAVAMTTIRNFERALGRFALWGTGPAPEYGFVRRLRVYPHALRAANAYYSPRKKALLFGYFPAMRDARKGHFPGGMVFTCLSHDIIAHETTHALLDGMHRRWIEPSHPDTLAFHEAFADIVALFQHFSFPTVLRHQIAQTRGDLASENALGQLAQQFGRAIGQHGALRDAIGGIDPATRRWKAADPDPEDMQRVFEPHARGAILVAAVFDAFLAIYRRRVADLYRIATSGTGVLPAGALHPDLVNRLADEASKSAQHVLNMCIRALDYCPPVDVNFGDYLRGLITADSDLVPDDDLGYRIAFIEAFRRRGIYPRDIRTLSVDSLRWPLAMRGSERVLEAYATQRLEKFADRTKEKLAKVRDFATTRQSFHERSRAVAAALHDALRDDLPEDIHALAGGSLLLQGAPADIDRDEQGRPRFEVHSVRAAQRVGPDGDALNHAVVCITQKRRVPIAPGSPETFAFRGGCTLILNLDTLALQYVIGKRLDDEERLQRQIEFRTRGTLAAFHPTYGSTAFTGDGDEPFALLHRAVDEVAP